MTNMPDSVSYGNDHGDGDIPLCPQPTSYGNLGLSNAQIKHPSLCDNNHNSQDIRNKTGNHEVQQDIGDNATSLLNPGEQTGTPMTNYLEQNNGTERQSNDHGDGDIPLGTEPILYGNLGLSNAQIEHPSLCDNNHTNQVVHFDYGEAIDKANDPQKNCMSKSGYTSDTLDQIKLKAAFEKQGDQPNFFGKTKKTSVSKEDERGVNISQTKNPLVNQVDQQDFIKKTRTPSGNQVKQQQVRNKTRTPSVNQIKQQQVRNKTRTLSGNEKDLEQLMSKPRNPSGNQKDLEHLINKTKNPGNQKDLEQLMSKPRNPSGNQKDLEHLINKTRNPPSNQDNQLHGKNNTTTPLLNPREQTETPMTNSVNENNGFGSRRDIENQDHSGSNSLKRYRIWMIIYFAIGVLVVVVILCLSIKDDNQSTGSSAATPLAATPQGPPTVTPIHPSMQLKKQIDNVPEFPGKMIYIPFGKEGLSSNTGIQGDHLIITEPGVYHVYANIYFRPDSVHPCKDFKEQKWSFLIEVNSTNSSVKISSYVTCSLDIANFKHTSFIGQHFKLEKGDVIRVAISGKGLVYFNTLFSYLELIKTHEHSEGTFAHVDLIPPSVPPLNSVTQDREMIYIAFERRKEEPSSIIDIQGDRLRIIDPGVYYAYAKIDFRTDSVRSCKDFKEQIWSLFVEVNSSANSQVKYFRAAVTCSQVTAGFEQTSCIGFLYKMNSGDVVRIAVSGPVSFKSNSSNLELSKIKNQNGPYAHVDLLPPSKQDMNNETKEKVPEFSEQKIYIPFERESLSSNINIHEDRITINDPGQYFVYANIDFRPDSVRPCKDFKEQTWNFTLEVYSTDGTPKELIPVKVTCDPESAGFEQTSFTGKSLMLESGDFLRVLISAYGLAYYKSHASFVGLYKI